MNKRYRIIFSILLSIFTLIGGHFYNRRAEKAFSFLLLLTIWMWLEPQLFLYIHSYHIPDDIYKIVASGTILFIWLVSVIVSGIDAANVIDNTNWNGVVIRIGSCLVCMGILAQIFYRVPMVLQEENGTIETNRGIQATRQPTDAFVVVNGAMWLEVNTDGTPGRMSYKLNTDYPATAVISEITKYLSETGWSYCDASFDSTISRSTGGEWKRDVAKDSNEDTTVILRWQREWKNMHNDHLIYSLTYFFPEGNEQQRKELAVMALFIPKRQDT